MVTIFGGVAPTTCMLVVSATPLKNCDHYFVLACLCLQMSAAIKAVVVRGRQMSNHRIMVTTFSGVAPTTTSTFVGGDTPPKIVTIIS